MIFKSSRNYGEVISNLKINGKAAPYPVLNERAVRAGAGLMFVLGFATMMYVVMSRDVSPLRLVIPLFFIDFLLKVFQGPQVSPFGILGGWLVSNQRPEWVGAIQKRFAWSIGLAMASAMMVLVLWLGVRGVVPLVFCGVCLVFMWLETSVGLCVGCKIYSFLLDKRILPEPDVRPACAGGVCQLPAQK